MWYVISVCVHLHVTLLLFYSLRCMFYQNAYCIYLLSLTIFNVVINGTRESDE